MCYECHGTKKQVLEGLIKLSQQKDFHFEKWNTTSISGLFISMTGHDGDDCRRLAIQVYKEFLIWYSDKKDNYFLVHGTEQMWSISCLKKILIIVEENNDKEKEVIEEMIENELELDRENVKQVSLLDMIEKNRKKVEYNKNIKFISIVASMFLGIYVSKKYLI